MANANESATQSQINELVADIGQKLSALSAEEIGRLHGKKDQFVEQCGAVATKLSQLEPAAPPAHETIRIPCTIGSRKYLACGFLKAGEPSVKGRTMLERTRVEGTRPIDDAAWEQLYEHRAEFDNCTEFKGKILATERRSPRFPQDLSYFRRGSLGWCGDSRSVEAHWRDDVLVLRVCS